MPIAMARHILVKTSAEAEQLKIRLKNGEDFSALAKRYSFCPSKKRGGDLGEIRPGQMVKQFENAVFKLPINKIHGPLKTQFGWHLILIYFRG